MGSSLNTKATSLQKTVFFTCFFAYKNAKGKFLVNGLSTKLKTPSPIFDTNLKKSLLFFCLLTKIGVDNNSFWISLLTRSLTFDWQLQILLSSKNLMPMLVTMFQTLECCIKCVVLQIVTKLTISKHVTFIYNWLFIFEHLPINLQLLRIMIDFQA